jgi:predicted TPR repeat methyltransferase
MQQLKNNPNWAQQFAQAESEVVNTANDLQRNSQAVKAYLTLAVAAARAAQQNDGAAPAGRSTSTSGINDPAAGALARTLGIDATDLTKLNAYIRRQGETVNPKGTGSESLDALLRAARLLR